MQTKLGSDGNPFGEAMAMSVRAGEGIWIMALCGVMLVLCAFVSSRAGHAVGADAAVGAHRDEVSDASGSRGLLVRSLTVDDIEPGRLR